ncbi:SsrA-binding protein SmpB [Buchnera aphidicola]|uniref:SsrA-binding protein SmpB n=1 Tax=Buchnera aphidicola TaxID=9 RepID=UPI0031B84C52
MNNKKKNIICVNKKIKYNYFIINKIVSGIVLQGWEVKSLRKKKVDINNSYISFIKNEVYLINSIIYATSCIDKSIPIIINRNRKLLLKKKQIKNLLFLKKKKRYTFVSFSLFWKKNFCKLKFALAKGKKKYDKRMIDKLNTWKMEKLKLKKK